MATMTRPLRISLGVNEILDQQPERNTPVCIVCATWVCRGCWGFRRAYADRSNSGHRICSRCGSNDGIFLATRHASWKLSQSFWANGYRHPSLRRTPFMVPTMDWVNMTDEQLGSMNLGCPAGNPCPSTGCPACCPSYDPCGKAGCDNCKVDTMRVPEEANIPAELLGDNTPLADAAEEAGLPTLQQDTPDEAQEQAFRVSEDEQSIEWQGAYYHRQVEPITAETLAQEGIDRRMNRRDAMEWAVRLHETSLRSQKVPAKSVTETAENILCWLMRES